MTSSVGYPVAPLAPPAPGAQSSGRASQPLPYGDGVMETAIGRLCNKHSKILGNQAHLPFGIFCSRSVCHVAYCKWARFLPLGSGADLESGEKAEARLVGGLRSPRMSGGPVTLEPGPHERLGDYWLITCPPLLICMTVFSVQEDTGLWLSLPAYSTFQ
jgi:hypothetical protein